MSLTWKDRIKVASATTGTGTLTLGAAASGYQTFASGDNGKLFAYVIEDGTAWETGYGTYTHSGTTFARTARTDSSTGSAISCTGAEFLFVDWIAGVAQDDIYALDNIPVAVTGATTATIGKWHVVTGTSADYTITLPAGTSAGPSDCLGFIFAEALTKLVTLDGSETINGATTRIQRNGEVTILRWDTTEWIKIGGKSVPLFVRIGRSTDQSLTTGVYTLCNLTTFASGSSAMHNTNNAIITRPGDYLCVGEAYMNGLSTAAFFQVNLNGTTAGVIGHQMTIAGGGAQGYFARQLTCAVGDTVNLYAYGDGTPVLKASVNAASLIVREQGPW